MFNRIKTPSKTDAWEHRGLGKENERTRSDSTSQFQADNSKLLKLYLVKTRFTTRKESSLFEAKEARRIYESFDELPIKLISNDFSYLLYRP